MADLNQNDSLKEKIAGKKVMITGGLGMIGSTIAHLLVKYNAEVTIVDACLESYGANLFNLNSIQNRVEVIIADIRDKEAMRFLIKGKDIIFNLAAQVSHNKSISDPLLDAEINYIGHLNILDNIKKINPKARVLYPGSRLQFGPIEKIPVNESHSLRPKTPYAFNKTVAENMYLFYHEIYGISSVILRISNPYGIHCQMKHSEYSIINFFIRQAMENKALMVFGDGNQLRDYLYVEDLARVFVLAAVKENIAGEVFNVGSGVGTRFKDMANMVARVVGKGKVEHVPWPEDYLNVETGDYITDITKVSKILDWQPLVNLEEGIIKTFQYYEKYKDKFW